MATVIYVFSDPPNESLNRYKIGSHTGNKEKLITRYITSHPEIKLYYFIETDKAVDIENMFKRIHRDRVLKAKP